MGHEPCLLLKVEFRFASPEGRRDPPPWRCPGRDRAWRETGRLTYEINVQQYACAGLNFGIYYDRSPIIAYDGVSPPPYTMGSFTPSTVPGCRTPHLWCADNVSLYHVGPEFTLLRFDPAADVMPLVRAASERKVPLKLLDVAAPAEIIREAVLVLLRPDQHVGWRGQARQPIHWP
jgi:hypothetical protein